MMPRQKSRQLSPAEARRRRQQFEHYRDLEWIYVQCGQLLYEAQHCTVRQQTPAFRAVLALAHHYNHLACQALLGHEHESAISGHI
jgi:hypothetical protein